MKILSLKSVLLYQLGRILLCDSKANSVCFTDFLQTPAKSTGKPSSTASQKILNWREIPLSKKQQTSSVLYISPLPQTRIVFGQVGAGPDPTAPARAIANRLNHAHSLLKVNPTNRPTSDPDQTPSIEAQLWLEFKIETQKPGWIAFCLSEKGLDRWLQHLQTPPLSSANATTITDQSHRGALIPSLAPDAPTTQMLWQAQYTHACCARLLRQKRIAPEPGEQSRQPPVGSGLDRHAAGLSLIHALVDTSDSLFWIPYQWPTQQYLLLLKHVMPLCQAFERFYGVCLCEFQRPYAVLTAPEMVERSRQMILLSATKNVLKVLLEAYLGELAPEQL